LEAMFMLRFMRRFMAGLVDWRQGESRVVFWKRVGNTHSRAFLASRDLLLQV